MNDFIADAVRRARAHSPNPPRLNRPVPKMRVAISQPRTPQTEESKKDVRPRLGQPTGPDGRPVRKSYALPSLSHVLRGTIREQGWQEELGHGWIFGNWSTLVGETVAEHAVPNRIEDCTLYINCDNSAWATNLRYMQKQILQRIEEKVGPDIVVNLHISGPKQHKNYEGPQWVKPQGSQDTYG